MLKLRKKIGIEGPVTPVPERPQGGRGERNEISRGSRRACSGRGSVRKKGGDTGAAGQRRRGLEGTRIRSPGKKAKKEEGLCGFDAWSCGELQKNTFGGGKLGGFY